MTALGSEPVETWPVAQSSAFAAAVPVVVIADSSVQYGYAILAEDEIRVEVFPDAKSLYRALTAIYTRNRWRYPLSWQEVQYFQPPKPPHLYLVDDYEDDDPDAEDDE